MITKVITTALPYVNATPHLGNIVGCLLPADILARYYRKNGKNVFYIGGLDEYGTATEIAAQQQNTTPQKLCNKHGRLHKEIYDWFQFSFDFFGKTSTSDPQNDKEWQHTVISQDIFEKLDNNGYIFEKETERLYCEELDMFVADRFIIGTCPRCKEETKGDQCDVCDHLFDVTEIIDPRYKFNTSYKLVFKKTSHLFLDLPKLEPELINWFNKYNHGWSKNTVSITNTWFNMGLQPRCITRDIKWGTPLPNSIIKKYGSDYVNKVMYNWFDAPIGYISITANIIGNDRWKELWKNNEKDIEDLVEIIQVFAKDNVPFHTIIFPATLIGCNDNYRIAQRFASSHYLTYCDKPFSKSKGVGIFGDQVIKLSKQLGINEDYWRYYLIKIRPEKTDSSFTWTDFVNSINADLVNCYGNYVNRCFSMTKRYCNNIMWLDTVYYKEYTEIERLQKLYDFHFNKFELREALRCMIELASIGNKFLQRKEPWALYKKNPKNVKITSILAFALKIVFIVTENLLPFIPKSAQYILDQFENITESGFNLANKKYNLPFKPLDIQEIEKINSLII